MRVCYCPGYYVDLPENHPFPMGEFPSLQRILLAEGLLCTGDIHRAPRSCLGQSAPRARGCVSGKIAHGQHGTVRRAAPGPAVVGSAGAALAPGCGRHPAGGAPGAGRRHCRQSGRWHALLEPIRKFALRPKGEHNRRSRVLDHAVYAKGVQRRARKAPASADRRSRRD